MEFNFTTVLGFLAWVFTLVLAVVVPLRKGRSLGAWCFSAGMVILAIETAFDVISLGVATPDTVRFWQTLALLAKSFLPGVWLFFSLTYSRGNYREFLARWRLVLIAAFLLPLGLLAGLQEDLLEVLPYVVTEEGWWVSFGDAAKIMNALLLVCSVLIMMNLERTFRSAVGTMQWRIKFLVLGLGVIFGARVYTRSQALLFSGYKLGLVELEVGALLIGCTLIAIAYLRTGLREIDVYPSRAVLHTSITVVLAGAYLFFVGILAQVVGAAGHYASFQLQTLFILLGIVVLAVLLLSDRARQKTQRFVSRHFKRPQHDFREIWSEFTQSVSGHLDRMAMSVAAAKLISTTFNVLSVSVWLFDGQKEQLSLAASTSSASPAESDRALPFSRTAGETAGILPRPFDLEKAKEEWTANLRSYTTNQFEKGGNRLCIPLLSRGRWLGAVVLADRVSGLPYSAEELDLLQCIGDQLATGLLNVQLTEEILQGKEQEAFRTMSTFFVHDLKNAASSLTLTLKNLPIHFDDPNFREDALRGIGKTVNRINQLIERLSVLRRKLAIVAVELDLTSLVEETLGEIPSVPEVELEKELTPLLRVVVDRDQIHSVLTNLVLNARDAVLPPGRVTVKTKKRDGWAVLSVTDDGCGMSPAFIRESLFRPFITTKKNGLGIGMFQSKMIVEAHGGNIQVESTPGTGTTFRVMLRMP